MKEIRTPIETAIARCGWLAVAGLVLWLLLAGPAYLLAGKNGLEGLSYAAILCLLPGGLVFFLASRYGVANTPVSVVLSATVVRLLFVLAGTLVVLAVRQDLRFREFVVWLLAFYMATLVAETWLVLRRPSEQPAEPNTSQTDC